MGILLFSCNALFSIKNQYFSRRVFWWNGAQHIFSYFFFQKKKGQKNLFPNYFWNPHLVILFFEFFLKMEWHFFLSFFNFFPTRKKQQITLCVVRLCVNLRASFFLVLLCGGGYLSFNVQIKCVRHKRVDVVVSSCSM